MRRIGRKKLTRYLQASRDESTDDTEKTKPSKSTRHRRKSELDLLGPIPETSGRLRSGSRELTRAEEDAELTTVEVDMSD